MCNISRKKRRVSGFDEIDTDKITFVSFFNIDQSTQYSLKGPLSQNSSTLRLLDNIYQYAFVNMMDGELIIIKGV